MYGPESLRERIRAVLLPSLDMPAGALAPCEALAPRLRALRAMAEAGISIPQWARSNGFHVDTVKAVIYGKALGTRGEAHRVAVALGIKPGRIVEPAGFVPLAPRRRT